MRPGGAQSRAEAAENQRLRIFGALVAVTAERGYEGTRLEDLVEISGVSMRSFYELFEDKEAAFVAALELLLERSVKLMLVDPGASAREAGEVEISEQLRALGELIDQQEPAARMCLIESYVAGPKAADLVERSIVGAEALVLRHLGDSPDRAAMPAEMAVAAVGAVVEVLRGRLMRRAGSTDDLMRSLASFLSAFRPPVNPLRSAARAPAIRPESSEASDHAERALRAFEALLAEGRFAEVTMEQVAERAKMSRRTLYANFPDRQGLLVAAVDSACAQVAAVAVSAFNRHEVPVDGLRAAFEALLAFLASRPNLAHLLLIAGDEGGEPVLRRRDRGLRPVRALLRSVPASPPGSAMSGIAIEASLGGLLALMRRRFKEAGPSGLVGLGPICTYIALTPLVGPVQATTAAEGRAYRRGRSDFLAAVAHTDTGVAFGQIPMSLDQPRPATEIAEEVGLSREQTEALLAELLAVGLIELVEDEDGDGEPLYRSTLPLISTGDWRQIDQAERESTSATIGRLIEIEVEEAFAAGTFDSRPDRHLVRIPARLDEQGWREMHDRLNLTTDQCLDIERRARERLAADGAEAEGISTRVYIVSFEAAPSAGDR